MGTRFVSSLVLTIAGLAFGCSSGSSPATCTGDKCDAGMARDGSDGASDGAGHPEGGAVEASATCIPTAGPDVPDDNFTDSNCDGIDGDIGHAIFVSPNGSDSAAGTMSAPVASIAKGIELATAGHKDVYICNSSYAENVTVTGTVVNLYGGFDCAAGWVRSRTRAKVAPASGVALTVKDVGLPMVIDGVDLQSPNAVTEGDSSIALFVVNALKLGVSHSMIEAGDGAPGIAGAAVSPMRLPFGGAKRGTSLGSATCSYSSPTNPSACSTLALGAYADVYETSCSTSGAVKGGGGGDGNNRAITGVSGHGKEGTQGFPAAGATSGTNGLPGANGTAGAAASIGFGSVDANGYAPSNAGSDGANGQPGQSGTGGRGGDSDVIYTGDIITNWFVGGGGSQGGRAGCGGLGGKAGGGGGASIGALFVNSAVELNWVEIHTANGGKGGAPSDGATGQPGSPGAVGGTGTAIQGDGQNGGNGGDGGKGGAGGPGGGGPSIAVVATGITPLLQAVTLTPGSGGLGGVAISGPDGKLGESAETKFIGIQSADGGADGGAP